MKKIIHRLLILVATACSGCIAYPKVSPVHRFRGRVVYICNSTLPNGTKRYEGQGISNAPVHVWYVVENKQWQMVVAPRTIDKTERHYYTFTEEDGSFTVPWMWRPHLAVRSTGRWTTISKPHIQFITDAANLKIVGNLLSCPYLRIDGEGPEHLQKFLETSPSPLHWGDRRKLESFRKDIANQVLRSSALTFGGT